MRSFATTVAAAVAALVLADAAAQAPAAYRVPAAAPAELKRAVESAARPAEQRARDADRKPAETLMLADVGAGDRVEQGGAVAHAAADDVIDRRTVHVLAILRSPRRASAPRF